MTGEDQATRLLAAAHEIMAKVPDCWAATASGDGGVHARVVQPIPPAAGEDEWTICFATSARSRKAREIRASGRFTLGYQHHPTRAYVVVAGRAELVTARAEIRERWNEGWRQFFPGGPDDPNTALVRIDVDHVELCAVGVTPEPFGSRYSALERDCHGRWAVLSA